MASSSVSQESLDMDDFDTSARRNRIRVHRGHTGRGAAPFRGLPDRGGAGEGGHEDGGGGPGGVGCAFGSAGGRDVNGEGLEGSVAGGVSGVTGLSAGGHSHHGAGDHESPTRSAAARLKDKQRGRPNHMKGKLPKDKRKLREKRRSTGVVHCMPSTESTGDSLDDDDDDELVIHDTKKNTMYNEGTVSSHHHQSLYEARSNTAYSHQRRNKSPSDLEADLEDNQDYDSTVSHSETNLSLIGRSESSELPPSLPSGRSVLQHHHHHHHHHHQNSGMAGSKGAGSSPGLPEKNTGTGFLSKYSPETNRAMKFSATGNNNTSSNNNNTSNMANTSNNGSSDADSSRTNTPSTSSSSSVLSRWRDYPDTSPALSAAPTIRSDFSTGQHQPSPDSPRRFGSGSAAAPTMAPGPSGQDPSQTPGSQPVASVSSPASGSTGSIGGSVHSRPLGFSKFRESSTSGGNSNIAASTGSNTNTTGWARRVRERDGVGGGGVSSSIHTRMANYQSPRPYGALSSSILQSQSQHSSGVLAQHQNSETVTQLEKQLEQERENNKRLQHQLEEKDKKIAELEKAIELLNSECDGLDEDNLKLQEENQALIRAMSKLTSNV